MRFIVFMYYSMYVCMYICMYVCSFACTRIHTVDGPALLTSTRSQAMEWCQEQTQQVTRTSNCKQPTVPLQDNVPPSQQYLPIHSKVRNNQGLFCLYE